MQIRYVTLDIPQAETRQINTYSARRPANDHRPTPRRNKIVLFGDPLVRDTFGRVILIFAAVAAIVLLLLMFVPRPGSVSAAPELITLGNNSARVRRAGNFASSHRTVTSAPPVTTPATETPIVDTPATTANAASAATATVEAPADEGIAESDPAAVEEPVAKYTELKVYFTVPAIDYTEQDLTDFARLLDFEAGSSWLPNDWQLKFGSVALNRLASREYPDTLHAVIYQRSQYSAAGTDRWYSHQPSQRALDNARYLLETGERFCPPSVLFQANFEQGSGIWEELYDDILGTTYLCYSEHPEYYE